MTTADDLKVFLNTFDGTATVAGWPQDPWASVLIPCLIGLAQQAVSTLPTAKLADYNKVKAAIW